jgi:hypothetical protein
MSKKASDSAIQEVVYSGLKDEWQRKAWAGGVESADRNLRQVIVFALDDLPPDKFYDFMRSFVSEDS